MAMNLLKEMEGKKLDPSIVIYNILMVYFCKVGKLEAAKDQFCSLSSKGLQPNVRTYNIMINR
jgi:pentatricopeptide repeat protein